MYVTRARFNYIICIYLITVKVNCGELQMFESQNFKELCCINASVVLF